MNDTKSFEGGGGGGAGVIHLYRNYECNTDDAAFSKSEAVGHAGRYLSACGEVAAEGLLRRLVTWSKTVGGACDAAREEHN